MEDLDAQGTVTVSPWLRLRASAVHLYTASGAVLTLLILIAAYNGNTVAALWLVLATLIIDSTDGLLARRFRVKELLPGFDGGLLDNIVDYMTYVLAPILLLWSAGYLPSGTFGVVLAALPILASSYQFCRVDAKTGDEAETDHFFLGFPSYWNIAAFYVIIFDPGTVTVGAILLVCSLLVFVPIRYVYPSRTLAFRKLTITLTALWLLSYVAILVQMPDPDPVLRTLSLLYLVYYFGVSFYISWKMLKDRRTAREAA
ncbi:MAG: Phosphatidylcholine synthase [uncultured Rubrobacteraceae bacterium]|uniref:Phosphatidylcholine synthase n=1 Tax=uncultured Rubrobacteraceae bacterium TaxID=349277 RepID=A0A6J4PD95_9ACTN|nr:MAG: Phosphatidylcholine synthase [uncultured Rubrobacteraceae bacterium]